MRSPRQFDPARDFSWSATLINSRLSAPAGYWQISSTPALPVARLTEVFRQAAESRHRINRGDMPEWPKPGSSSDFYFVECTDPEDGAAKVVEIVRDRLPRRFGLDAIRDVQVLCPMQRGAMGARALNAELQNALNPNPSAQVERFGSLFRPGDKVMQTENDYEKEVFNGDLGMVVDLNVEENLLLANFDGREIEYAFGELDRLVPAYATTIHKSQGSEYPAVVITLATQHYTMLARNLLYTAVTRGRRAVIVVGQRKAVAIAIRTSNARRRWTKLDEWLAPSRTAGRLSQQVRGANFPPSAPYDHR